MACKLKDQRGLSLTGLILSLAVIAVVAIVALQIVPAQTEYNSIKKAVASARASGTTPKEIRDAFDRQAEVGYITSLSGADLDIEQNNGIYEVGFAYRKVIPLFGPASLVLDYHASTAPEGTMKTASR
ncbi:DUF4845 domain-containing protein [Noviherbaspirillum sp. DKR-6]|uniref:DUF4845 domain-containing protein n=2 Tax=Noviherbaspirillum pedocola TaxID=2801341 RepID=A0A934SVK1_9BURK|nr:DUF4845 domain-containing protein [Noviherbaspirillum pedocola]